MLLSKHCYVASRNSLMRKGLLNLALRKPRKNAEANLKNEKLFT
jgi:hypothetical protein